MSERTWLASTSSVRVDDAVRAAASCQLPTRDGRDRRGERQPARRPERGGTAGGGRGPAASRSAARTRARKSSGASSLGISRGDGLAERQAVVAEAPAGRALREVRLELDGVARGELAVEIRVDLGFHVGVGHLSAPCRRRSSAS